MMKMNVRKKLLVLFVLPLLLASCSVHKNLPKKSLSGNPIFAGWYADPHTVIYDKTYWVYPTFSADYDKQVFMDCFSSKDLVNWTKHSDIIDSSSVKWAKKCFWAPAPIKKDGNYYLFFGANDVHEGEIGGIGVGVSSKPEGPYKDLLGKPLINKIVNGAQPIDQFVYEENGQYYMYYGGWGHCNVVKLKPDFSGLLPFEDGTFYKEITPDKYVEGSFMIKRNGKYYFMWSEGGWGGPDYCVAYAISDSPFGPFNRVGKILEQDAKVARGAGHHSMIYVPKNDSWYIFYHRRPLTENQANNREVCIDKVEFDQDGFIKPVKITVEGVAPSKVK